MEMMQSALAAIARFVPEGSRVVDLHAGVGTIGGHSSGLRVFKSNVTWSITWVSYLGIYAP